MRGLRYIIVLLVLALATGFALGTGCGAASIPGPPAEIPEPVTINYLDGGKGIPVDSTFKYIFSRPVKVSTVNTSTFFMVKHEHPIPDPICDPSYAVDATVESLSVTEFVLTPTDPLEYNTTYTICLTQDIQYATGEQFEGVTATFTTEVEGPLNLNGLDGAVDVPVNSTFRYRFLREIDASTVNGSTFFIVPVAAYASLSKAVPDPVICDPVNAVNSEMNCTNWSCTIEPIEILDYLYDYTACLTSDISYQPVDQSLGQLEIQSQATFGGFMASFTTAQWIISSIKLVRLDGTELDLTDRPIPRMVHIKFTFFSPVADEEERFEFEEAVNLMDIGEISVEGSWIWADDFTSASFIPTWRLEYRTEYIIGIDTHILPMPCLSKALENENLSFTTMTDRDVNGDGYADVIVGADGYPEGKPDGYHGRAYIFLGSESGVSDTSNATITGIDYADFVGSSVAIGGDINADGYADVMVGAYGIDVGGTYRGQTYMFLGSASGIDSCDLSDPSCVPDATITGRADWDQLGWSASIAGDVNADGYDDAIVTAFGVNAGSYRGQAYIFLGSQSGLDNCDLSDPSCVPDTIITGEADGDNLGGSASTAGDVNGDGYDDILLSAYSALGNTGKVYVFLGSETGIDDCNLSDPQCIPDTTITGGNAFDYLGYSVSTGGDVNGDGYDDILMSSGIATDFKGRGYIFHGSADGISSCAFPACAPNTTIVGENDFDFLGDSFSNAGDINNDGYDDVIIGSLWFEADSRRGKAYLFTGSAEGIGNCDMSNGCTSHARITGKNAGDRLGASVSTTGDVNGDGYDDVIAGARWFEGGINKRGQAYVFLGGTELVGGFSANDADNTISGENEGDRFGYVRQP